jgi:cellulose synthase/poly-beta-1,6-N-acetylglucosamine synthase-like glycosyltransferase
MLNILNKVVSAATRNAGILFICGILGIIFLNWRLWQRDKALLNPKSLSNDVPPLDSWSNLPLVSILVAAWNEAENIELHINSYKTLRYPNKELILCAGGEDRTFKLAQRNTASGMVVLEQIPDEGKQHALNRCFNESKGTIIYLTDADCLLDDESFELLIFQITSKGEEAASGSSQPSNGQLSNPFVLSQASSQIYRAQYSPTYAPGLLGRNCAIKRELLECSHGLEVPVKCGTDYVLAKKLSQTGAQIRQVPNSRVVTEYPSSISEYARQQLRWLNNVVYHGDQHGAHDEIRDIYTAYLTGITMLLLPFIGFVPSKMRVVSWSLLFWHAWLSRIRYLRFLSTLLGIPMNFRLVIIQPILLLVDFTIWVRSLIENVLHKRGQDW